MPKCVKCRKADSLDSWVDRIKSWFVWHWFGESVGGEKSASFTQGFSDGYTQGRKHEREAVIREKETQPELFYLANLASVTVNPKKVIVQDPRSGEVRLGTDKLTPVEAKILQEEAKFVKNSRLYDIFLNTVRQQAIDLGFSRSKNFEETLSGKLMVHDLEILRDIVHLCISLRDISG